MNNNKIDFLSDIANSDGKATADTAKLYEMHNEICNNMQYLIESFNVVSKKLDSMIDNQQNNKGFVAIKDLVSNDKHIKISILENFMGFQIHTK